MGTTTMPENLTKRDIVLDIYQKLNSGGVFPGSSYLSENREIRQKEIKDIVQMTLDSISSALVEGRNVELRNFGVFELQTRKERVGRNPNEPEKDVIIPQRLVVKFKAGKELKARLKDIKT